MENVKLVKVKNGQISLRYIWENLKTCLVVVGQSKPATMLIIRGHLIYGDKELSDLQEERLT